jgi:predicted adenylyl cyclase CyaB
MEAVRPNESLLALGRQVDSIDAMAASDENHEIEVKILEVDPAAMASRLKELGATLEFSGEMHAIFFDDAEGHVGAEGNALRLRREGDASVLAFKRRLRKDTAKVMDEQETAVSCFDTMRRILAGLGYNEIAETRKWRDEFELPATNAKVVIDRYKDALSCVPPFIEVEAESEALVISVVKMLGLSPDDCLSWDTRDLAKHYGVAFT